MADVIDPPETADTHSGAFEVVWRSQALSVSAEAAFCRRDDIVAMLRSNPDVTRRLQQDPHMLANLLRSVRSAGGDAQAIVKSLIEVTGGLTVHSLAWNVVNETADERARALDEKKNSVPRGVVRPAKC